MVAQRNIPRSSAAAAGAVLYPTTSHRPTSALRKDEHVLMSGAFSGPDLITGGSHAYHLNLRPSLCAAHCFFIILRPATLIFEVIPECIGYASRSSLAFLHCTQAASRCTALGTVCVWFKADTAAGARFLACSTSGIQSLPGPFFKRYATWTGSCLDAQLRHACVLFGLSDAFPHIYDACCELHQLLVLHLSLHVRRLRHATAAASSVEPDLRHLRVLMQSAAAQGG